MRFPFIIIAFGVNRMELRVIVSIERVWPSASLGSHFIESRLYQYRINYKHGSPQSAMRDRFGMRDRSGLRDRFDTRDMYAIKCTIRYTGRLQGSTDYL